ncbi:MAG: Ni/Fe hydrogenase subunit alpha [Rhodothermales bacterium]|nr:Ni/Fe hydrogenase subunit alpha [Rhodothermales bacterium]
MAKTRTIKVDYLARVEGEGALHIRIRDGEVKEAKLKIFEPPRFFEAFLEGRMYTEAPDITARICGICPIAYQMGASHAMENAIGVTVNGTLRDLRHLIYCGEWIESHALHIFMLHAPDFLGYQDAVQMAKDHPDIVKTGLRLKKAGNLIMQVLGGREIHPINLRIGGFYSVPTRSELEAMRSEMEWGLAASKETLQFLSTLTFPDFERDYEFVALRNDSEYAILDGRIVSNKGVDIAIDEFEQTFVETHVKHSTSLHAHQRDRGAYLVGPMARYNLNFDRLSSPTQEAAVKSGLGESCTNPFKSILIRCVELIHAFELSLQLIDRYVEPAEASVPVAPRASTGAGCTEAPRGICWHEYEIDDAGLIKRAQIVPPTSQNQACIEEDMRQFAAKNLDMDNDQLQWVCEQGIRNYDPCISCSCHFLNLTVDRS